jgi:hypothetical protein
MTDSRVTRGELAGQGEFTLHPGFACNGHHGFFAGGR